uniref:Cleavage inducing molecular chaperone Jiv domain-containing protein n=1 Tax=Cyprinodon variegatus TaxID=28743 RepID=A0A3Q2CF78_CYPVA
MRMAATELSKSMNEFLTKLQDDLKEAMNTMMCTKCEGKHKRFEMDRDPAEARFCAECNRCHSAEEGDLWAESSMLGLRITYFACMEGKVFDITEWAGCQRISISPDTHRVPYHISFGSKNGNAARHRYVPATTQVHLEERGARERWDPFSTWIPALFGPHVPPLSHKLAPTSSLPRPYLDPQLGYDCPSCV